MANDDFSGEVLETRSGPVITLTMSYPARRNAFSLAIRASLHDKLAQAMSDESCRAIVIAGEGEHFCSGGDISSFDGVTAPSGRARMQAVQRIARLIVRGEKPVIAAIEGYAAGAGLCVAAACDIVVASESAKFSCAFNKIGLAPDLGAAWSLPARMGLGRAKMFMLSGRTLDAASAERQGLAELVCAKGEALAQAQALALEISSAAPLSNAVTKSLLSYGPRDFDAALGAEADAQAVLFGSEDFAEGWRAFMEKRAPDFRGR